MTKFNPEGESTYSRLMMSFISVYALMTFFVSFFNVTVPKGMLYENNNNGVRSEEYFRPSPPGKWCSTVDFKSSNLLLLHFNFPTVLSLATRGAMHLT